MTAIHTFCNAVESELRIRTSDNGWAVFPSVDNVGVGYITVTYAKTPAGGFASANARLMARRQSATLPVDLFTTDVYALTAEIRQMPEFAA